MKWGLTLAILLCITASAQENLNAPLLVDTYTAPHIGTPSAGVADFLEPVVTGELVGLAVNVAGSPGALTCSDGYGTTFSYTTTATTPVPPDVTKITSVYFCYGASAGTGSETITVAGIGPTTPWAAMPFHYKNTSTTLCGTTQTATATGNPASIATTFATNTNGCLLLSVSGQANYYQDVVTGTYPDQMLSSYADAVPTTALLTQQFTGLTGNYTSTHVISQHTGAQRIAMVTIGFKPSLSIAITTTRLPDADTFSAYKACLGAVGGTAGYTFSSSGTPAGLSFSTSTGCYTSTATTPGVYTVSVSVTDGTVTSATVNLSLRVVAQFTNPSIIASGTLGTPTITYQCGDLIVLAIQGADTHTGFGWTAAGNGSANYFSLGGVRFTRLPVQQGVFSAPLVYYYARMTGAGSGLITYVTTSTGTPINTAYVQIRNGQELVDFLGASVYQPASTSPFTFAQSYASLVPNTLALLEVGTGNSFGGSLDGITFGSFATLVSPFATFSTTMAVADLALAAVTSSSENVTITVSGGFPVIQDTTSNLMLGVRPSANTCPATTYQGEKRRRHPW